MRSHRLLLVGLVDMHIPELLILAGVVESSGDGGREVVVLRSMWA